jgi:acetate kinase
MPDSGNEGSSPILVINGGSSTLKFALFRVGDGPVRELSGLIDRIGSPHGTFTWMEEGTSRGDRRAVDAPDHTACLDMLMACVDGQCAQDPLRAIGHRVVHGGREYREPQRVTPVVMEELLRLSPFSRLWL